MPEYFLKLGKKGEIYIPKEIREKLEIREGMRLKAKIEDNKLIIESLPSVESILNKERKIKLSPKDVEKISEEIQSELIEEAKNTP
jgi:AbrB family looped-hinge helix DNA binding protein